MFYIENSFNRRCIGTEYKFVWLPKRCFISNKFIWLKYAYKQTAMWTGPGDEIFEHRWYNRDEFIFWQLKNENIR